MDNKEKVLVDFAMKCINVDRKGEALNVNSYAKEALEKLQPSKVKLPKQICEILDRAIKEYQDNDYILYLVAQSPEELKVLNDYCNEEKTTNIAKALLHGYELEETEEERIRSEIRKIHFDAGIMVTDDVLEKLYNIATKK